MSNPIGQRGYDHVLIAGERTPGIATIEGADAPKRLIKRRGYGLSGATVRDGGDELSEFKIFVDLFTAADFDAWTAFLPTILRRRTEPATSIFALPRQRALDIQHPFLEDLGIRSVMIGNVTQPKQVEAGRWRVEISVCEYREPRPALAAVSGSDDRPETANERLIRELTAEFNAENEAGVLAGPAEAP